MRVFEAFRCAVGISGVTTIRSTWFVLPVLLVVIGVTSAAADEKAEKKELIRMIGATALATEVSTGLPLPARVDTGATCCSIHCEVLEIKGADPDPKVNIGKPIRFLIKPRDGDGKGEWVEAKIVDHVKVRTSEREDERYKVRLKLRVEDVEKKVLVTLNDREKMKYPLLLGRNFLRDDFLVNVSLNSEK
ncbi:MAG: RimK/LysX family protein [Planctomycetes bacterium]|nr:RimK/LysX family protein [Planctomycetota bacterium]